MKPRQRLALLLAACVLSFGRQMLGEQEVTFEVLATFDYPGALDTSAAGINERGDVVGGFINEFYQAQGFVRFADGTFSRPIVNPDGRDTYLEDINSAGTICGVSTRDGSHFHGFFLSGSTFTTFDLGNDSTYLRGLNDAGNFCGTTVTQGFVSIDGTLTTFAIPKTGAIDAAGINNLNQVVGGAGRVLAESSFRRDADGRLNWPIRAPGSKDTDLFGIDDKGRMVGFVTRLGHNTQAVFLRPSHQFAFFAYPGAIVTQFFDINNRGQICGGYYSSDIKVHGLIVQVKGDE